MNYEFPLINHIDDVLPAIEGRDEFVVAEKDGYTVINYNVMMADTFPDVGTINLGLDYDPERTIYDENGRMAAIRRECRGIIFNTRSGRIIRRPFHKFFNVNEREETQDHQINLSNDHVILEKLDGSMIAPFIVNGEMIWGTKMGATDVAKPVEEFVLSNPKYYQFAHRWLCFDYTPIFEWCSRKQRIVLDYTEDQLILTAMRNMYTGEYMGLDILQSNAKMFDIPVVRAFEPQSDMPEFCKYVHDLEDMEGFVVRFDDGHMVKLKCHWYLQIHRAKEAILQDRNIVEIILDEKLDDVKAHLPAEERERLTQFENDFNHAVKETASRIFIDIVDISQRGLDRKTFAIEIAPTLHGLEKAIHFALWDVDPIGHLEVEDRVRNTIRNNLGKTVKYEAVRDAWFPGIRYNEF